MGHTANVVGVDCFAESNSRLQKAEFIVRP